MKPTKRSTHPANSPLHSFQQAFCAHLRGQKESPRPKGTSARGMAVYRQLLFNNCEDFLQSCFPVCKKCIGQRAWRKLVRDYFAMHAAASPYFRDIPKEFLNWLAHYPQRHELPAWFSDMAHWEWVELAVSCHPAALAPQAAQPSIGYQFNANTAPCFNPTMQLLHYAWPVQRIAPRRQIKPQPVWLLAYRDTQSTVQFIELTAGSYALLLRLHAGESPNNVLATLAKEWQRPEPPLRAYAIDLLQYLHTLGVIVEAAPATDH